MDRARLKSISGQLDSRISRQTLLVKVAQENQKATDLQSVAKKTGLYVKTLFFRTLQYLIRIE